MWKICVDTVGGEGEQLKLNCLLFHLQTWKMCLCSSIVSPVAVFYMEKYNDWINCDILVGDKSLTVWSSGANTGLYCVVTNSFNIEINTGEQSLQLSIIN